MDSMRLILAVFHTTQKDLGTTNPRSFDLQKKTSGGGGKSIMVSANQPGSSLMKTSFCPLLKSSNS